MVKVSKRVLKSNEDRAMECAHSLAEEYVHLLEIKKRIDNQLKEVDKMILLVQRSSTLSGDHLSNPTFSRLRDNYLYCRRHVDAKIKALEIV